MATGKRNVRLPANVQELDFTSLRSSQLWVFGDWMQCRHALNSLKSDGDRQAHLRTVCLANLERAQQGYEVIVLQKQAAPTLAGDTEKRMYEVVTNIVSKHADNISEIATNSVAKSVAAEKDALIKFAKEQIMETAKRVAPLVIKKEGKLKTVKGVLPPEFKRMVELASARIPILLVGPAGCGKTYLCEKLADALDLEYGDQSCSEGMSESVFNGKLLPIGKGGAFDHVPSPWITRYEKGGVFLLDEMDAGDPNLFTYVNKAIANTSYTVDARWKNPVVKKHEDFVLVAAANTFGNGADAMYVGRNQLDAATLDRFKVGLITMDYNRDVETSLAPANLCDWAWKIRERIGIAKLRRVMSTRVIKDLATMTSMYDWKVEDWNRAYFTGWSDAERKLVGAM